MKICSSYKITKLFTSTHCCPLMLVSITVKLTCPHFRQKLSAWATYSAVSIQKERLIKWLVSILLLLTDANIWIFRSWSVERQHQRTWHCVSWQVEPVHLPDQLHFKYWMYCQMGIQGRFSLWNLLFSLWKSGQVDFFQSWDFQKLHLHCRKQSCWTLSWGYKNGKSWRYEELHKLLLRRLMFNNAVSSVLWL